MVSVTANLYRVMGWPSAYSCALSQASDNVNLLGLSRQLVQGKALDRRRFALPGEKADKKRD